MEYFILEPEATAELGDNSEVDASVHPRIVRRLHHVLMDWLGDDLVVNYPTYVITQKIAERVQAEALTGFQLADIDEFELSPDAEELLEGQEVPAFRWLKVHGVAGSEDLGLIPGQASLVVSERALAVLREGSLEHCDIEDYTT